VRWLLGIPPRFRQRLRNAVAHLREWLQKGTWTERGRIVPLLLFVVIVPLALFGVLTALPWWVGALVVAVAVLAAIRPVVSTTAHMIGAAIAGIVALAATNLVVDRGFELLGVHMPILLGLFVATLVFAVAARGYLLIAERPVLSAADTGLLLAVMVIVGVPIVVGLLTHEGTAKVPPPDATAPKVDVFIITDGSKRAETQVSAAGERTLSGFDVRYSVGVAEGARVRWTLAEVEGPQDALNALARGKSAPSTRAPTGRPSARPVVLLDVDRTPPVARDPEGLSNVPDTTGEVSRWRAIASGALPRIAARTGEAPQHTFVLLQSRDLERIAKWELWALRGHVLSRPAQTQTSVTAIAVAMGVGAPSSDADYALALRYRPVLLFDTGEKVPRPLSVNWLFETGRVKLCKDGGALADCTPVRAPSELKSGSTHLGLTLPSSQELRRLAFRDKWTAEEALLATRNASNAGAPSGRTAVPASPLLPRPARGAAPPGARELVRPGAPGQLAGGANTAIYVHPVADERDGRQLLYLDYWWYLSDNPSPVGGGALCGAGLVIPGITCENHVSDWEGMTVIVDRTTAHPFIESVHYAEHKDVIAYGWKQLLTAWKGDPTVPGFARVFAEREERPLAFSASGTHATYAQPCASGCRQVAADLGEGDRNGELPWIGDFTATCGSGSCVQVLPTYEGGTHPALWNAFAGTWGDRHCALTYYCDETTPPTSPGQQSRYAHPGRCTGKVNAGWEFNRDQCEP
jgi:hypothetical protein